MATDPLGPLYQHLHRVLDEQRVHEQDILREAGADVSVEMDDGGAVHVHHSGTVGRVEQITHAFECGDSAWLGQLIATLEHENNALRALLMMGDRFTAVLRDRVEDLEQRVSNHSAWIDVR